MTRLEGLSAMAAKNVACAASGIKKRALVIGGSGGFNSSLPVHALDLIQIGLTWVEHEASARTETERGYRILIARS